MFKALLWGQEGELKLLHIDIDYHYVDSVSPTISSGGTYVRITLVF